MPRLSPPVAVRLEDEGAERARQRHDTQIRELQRLPAMQLKVISGVSLANATETPIQHGLGREPIWVGVSPVRGASSSGRVEEVRSGTYDRRKVVVLEATGFGATVEADLVVL